MLLNDGVSDSGARVRVSRVSSYIDRHLFFFFLCFDPLGALG